MLLILHLLKLVLQSRCILLLLLSFNRWQLAHPDSLVAKHLILLFELLDLPLKLPDLDVLKLELTVDVIHVLLV